MYDNYSGSYQWRKHIYRTTAVFYSQGLADMNSTQMIDVAGLLYYHKLSTRGIHCSSFVIRTDFPLGSSLHNQWAKTSLLSCGSGTNLLKC